ncbi:MAG TPA: hypothetical protein VMG10_14680 [Gemmataceae bacterium]|nr:hypothetical protein [Gemmataceae bacterium]
MGQCFFWSAAHFRRFFSFGFQEKQAKQSGGKAPHSKKMAKPTQGFDFFCPDETESSATK